MNEAKAPARRFLIVYAQDSLWSMGEGIGAGAFSRTPRALARAGHEVHMVLPAPRGGAPGVEEFDGIRLHRYATAFRFHPRLGPLPIRLASRVQTYLAYQRIGTRTTRAAAERVEPDLILAYGTFEAPVARRVALRIGVPNVTRLFGNSLSLTLDDPVRFRLNFPEVWAFRTPCARLILTNDGANGQEVARRCGVPPDRFIHLRNGLDFSAFTPGPASGAVRDRLSVPADAPLLMTVTRLAPEKKLERLVDAMPSLLERVPNACAVLIGEGPERPALEERIRRLGVAHAVRLPGAIPNHELPDWYRTAAVVLSLLDRTNASNPVFEAMACERCVIALDAGTTDEVVVDGETGVLLGRDDLPRLGSILAELLGDPGRREALGRAARSHVRGLLLDPEDRMRQEIGILLDVIEEAKRKERV
ncbi:MAG: glycosyltransferase [Candidatus Eisenbacteria bacterium]|nr:glycosyltransferase [Candidatus Latescibacterota bacterium]MBD3303043.1 glycosyltransferase [Candidatus Eisenbacteria bacterium]